jgi:radical SAM superfamily enzyme YgiQ (UPF0313 family)
MRIFLLNPPARRVAEKIDTPPYQHIGLGYLISVLENNGYPAKVVDAKLNRLSFKDSLREIADYGPDILGITAKTHEVTMAAEVAAEYKRLKPAVKTVLGGVHITALPEDTLKRYPQIDMGITGEGEYSFIGMIDALKNGSADFSEIPGAVFRAGDGTIKHVPAERINDLDALPFPGWKHFKRATMYSLMATRGCPFACIFCMQALGRTLRKRSGENIIEEIETAIAARKPDSLFFSDETFTCDREWAHRICDMMISRGLAKKIRWKTSTRVDAVDRDILKKMKAAGCNHIVFGVESGNEETLKTIKKSITKEQAVRAVALAKELGFFIECGFILGHPHENMKTALETIDFAAKLNTNIADFGIMVPYPGTEIRRMAIRGEGGYRILTDDWSEYNKQLGNALEMVELNRSDLERLQLIGYLRLFIYNARYLDLAKFILRYRREMFSYLSNILRKRKSAKKTTIFPLAAIRLIFSRSIKNRGAYDGYAG